MKTISPEAREAAARFWDFLGHHGSANMIRNGTGFRTTAEVFAEFEEEIRAKVAAEMNQELLDFVRGIANAPDAACARAEQAWIWRDIAREWFE